MLKPLAIGVGAATTVAVGSTIAIKQTDGAAQDALRSIGVVGGFAATTGVLVGMPAIEVAAHAGTKMPAAVRGFATLPVMGGLVGATVGSMIAASLTAHD